MNGILLINKPVGLTSHDVVYRIKKKFNMSKVGHTGTLDPFATGLLILLLGKATKLAFLFDDLDKTYDGTVIFGNDYDTNDNTGVILDSNIPNFSYEELINNMNSFMPSYEQLPPMYSAIKVDGVKAYQAARQGKTLDLKKRNVQIYDFKLVSYDKDLKFIAHVSKGTYIRSLARDLGYHLNTFGALSQLNRLNIGRYSILDSKTIEDIEPSDLISDNEIFKHTKKLMLNDYMVRLVQNGVYLDHRQTTTNEPFVVVNSKGENIAYFEKQDDKYKPLYFF